MKLVVEFTGQLQSVLGRSADRMDIAPGTTLSGLIAQLVSICGEQTRPHFLTETGHVQPSLMVAVGGRVLACGEAASTALQEGDIVVFLPPIAGG